MSILIKGMEMPKDGAYWCEICVAGDIATITIHGEDRKSFHLVPVPPHGDLIDMDEFSRAMYHEAFEVDSAMQKWDSGCWIRYKMFERNIESAHVIIPAERSEE